jgi:ribosomal protein S18 acetylase RimI-like enzyme
VSEFYTARRNAITDLSAFFGFLIGFVGSAPFAYPFIRVGFETAQIVRGFAFFIGATMGAGVVVAIAGLVVGRGIGWFWERGHRLVRHARGQEFADEQGPLISRDARFVDAMPAAVRDEPIHAPQHDIQYRSGFDARAFAALMARAGIAELDVSRTGAALAHTRNIGAWDGARLVGAIRILGDGYTWSVVTDIVVDPLYRRRGIGRELMTRATDVSSGGLAIAKVPPGTEGFFRQIDALPPYEGFVRGGKAKLH